MINTPPRVPLFELTEISLAKAPANGPSARCRLDVRLLFPGHLLGAAERIRRISEPRCSRRGIALKTPRGRRPAAIGRISPFLGKLSGPGAELARARSDNPPPAQPHGRPGWASGRVVAGLGGDEGAGRHPSAIRALGAPAASVAPWRGRWCGGGSASIPTSSSPPRRTTAQRRHGLVPSFMIDPGYRHGRDQEHDHDDYCDHIFHASPLRMISAFG